MRALLASAIAYIFPFGLFTGGNGDPVAINALPAVHSFASPAISISRQF